MGKISLFSNSHILMQIFTIFRLTFGRLKIPYSLLFPYSPVYIIAISKRTDLLSRKKLTIRFWSLCAFHLSRQRYDNYFPSGSQIWITNTI